MSDKESTREQAKPSIPFSQKVLIAVGIGAAVVLVFLFLKAAVNVLLILFAGILLAVFLNGLTETVTGNTPLPRGWALSLVVFVLLGLLALIGWFIAPDLFSQIEQLSETLPASLDQLKAMITQYSWGRSLVREVPNPQDVISSGNVWGRITGIFSTTVGLLGNTLVILFVGLYLAANPGVYKRGIVLLVPLSSRERAREVLDMTGSALWSWLRGQLISMALIGVLVWLGLSLIGMPMALALGLIAGLLEFVPLIGPFVGAIPGILIALIDGPIQALYAALVYLAVQQLESNIITPLVMKEVVSIPPALTIAATILAGALFGLVGVLLATPLTVVLKVMIRAIYVQDVLGDKSIKPVQ